MTQTQSRGFKNLAPRSSLSHFPLSASSHWVIHSSYEVLSDPQTRAIYDERGIDGLTGGGGPGGPGMDDFAQLFYCFEKDATRPYDIPSEAVGDAPKTS
jgi:DnaJ-class molecular chaperone